MNCSGTELHTFLDLGAQPNGNAFLGRADIAQEPVFPLQMMVCQTCWQVQIAEFPSQDFLFSDHPYITGVNAPVVEHFNALAPHVVSKLGMKPGDLVLDIGCNDGTLLDAFRDAGASTLGIDPGKRVTDLAKKKGHEVVRTFFNEESARAFHEQGVRPKAITATAVFYHVPDLHAFVAGLEHIMTEDTVFVTQCVNLRDLIGKLEFDHFYHEHSCIHSVGALSHLFAQHGMRIQDVEFYEIHGGSFVVYAVKDSHPVPASPAVAAAIEAERADGLMSVERYDRFARDVAANMSELKSLLQGIREDGKSVYGLGAPLKGSTLLNYAEIGADLVEVLTEVNPYKIGLLTPGVHIPVIDENTVTQHPDYYLVLSWNFAPFLIRKYADYLTAGGKFIIPVPQTRVVGSEVLTEGFSL